MTQCSDDPRAPHGFLRNASHTEGRYVCECEYWEPEPDNFPSSQECGWGCLCEKDECLREKGLHNT